MAKEYKDLGNYHFQQKDYPKAIAKWARVALFTKPLLPAAADADQVVGMINRSKVPEELASEASELQATTLLNMAQAFYVQKKYDKAAEKSTQSLALNKSVKGYYRRGKAFAMMEDFERACEDLRRAIQMDESDPNNFAQELKVFEARAKAAEKERNKKMSGFLLK